jgi:DNA-binding XRE family transcriptional regulator
MGFQKKPTSTLDVFDYRLLRQIRKESGISSVGMEKHTTKMYHLIENGENIPSITTFSMICRKLELDPFSIAAILRQPCVTPSEWRSLHAASKVAKKSLKDITKEFIHAVRLTLNGAKTTGDS